MLKRMLHRYGIVPTTAILSSACVLASIAIVVIIGALTCQPDIRFTLAMAVLCPSIIAPTVIYYYSRLSEELDNSSQALEKLNRELQSALEEIQELSDLLPICAACKKIRDDKGYWNQIEHYIAEHAKVQFSHSICPDCAAALYPDIPLDDEETPGNPSAAKHRSQKPNERE
jgi:hypothetical protein